MVEVLQLLEAGLVFTAVTLAAVTLPVGVMTDTELPDLEPLIEHVDQKDSMSK